MRRFRFGVNVAVTLGLAVLVSTSAAEAAGDQKNKPAAHGGVVACRDGTKAVKAGPYTCAGHGGVATDANATNPPPDTPPRGAGDPHDPANATAQCKDGTFSHGRDHAAACAQNGGVAKWLDQQPDTGH
jgi:hypothetical protein